jgi:hypothetical protein
MLKNSKFLFILISFLIIFYQVSLGQENKNYSITGVLMDFESKQPIEFASVAIYKIPDTVLITGTITNAKGEFVLNKMISGKYIIKSSFVGYQTGSTNVEISKASVNLLEPIYLTASALSLNEVQVTATRNEKQVTIEKTKINVAQNISSVSGNVTEVLKS